MNNLISEKTIEDNLLAYFSGIGDFKTLSQVRFARKRIDIVIKSEVLNEIWAVEVKIRDWKTALRQATLNSVAFNHSYVAMWHQCAKGALQNKESFRASGVGLMVIDETYRPKIELNPRKSNYLNRMAYNQMLNIL